MTPDELTRQLIDALAPHTDGRSYERFVRPLKVVSWKKAEGIMELEVPGHMANTWLSEPARKKLLHQTLNGLAGQPVSLVVKVGKARSGGKPPQGQAAPSVAAPAPPRHKTQPPTARAAASLQALHPGYTFENFIVGRENRIVHNAALSVADKPGRGNPFNPLFLYSDSGMGKSHLMHAIAHELIRKNPNLTVRLLSAEQFMAEFIDLIRQRKPMSDFRQKYRHCDVFMVDDINLIAGREATEEEYFHTFNAVYEAGGQIIVTSDKHPKQLEGFQERMISRFAWGLAIDIKPPEFETRLAILQHKCAAMQFTPPEGALERLAQGIKSNVRELEGALLKLYARANMGEEVLLHHVEDVVSTFVREQPQQKRITADEIVYACASEFGVTEAQIKSSRRTKELVLPRHIAMYLCREYTQMSFEGLGDFFGGRNHATVLKAHKGIAKSNDGGVLATIERIKKRLGL